MDSNERSLIYSESGQVIIEYLLILVVTVGIILGIILQFNEAFRDFANNYFGNYLACLLETGELPRLGADRPEEVGTCNSEFQPFTFTAGRPPNPSSGSSGGLRNNTSRTGGARANGERKSDSAPNRVRPGKGARRGTAANEGSSGGRSRGFRPARSGTGSSSMGSSQQSGEERGREGGGSRVVGSMRGGARDGGDDYDDNWGGATRFQVGSRKKKKESGERIKSKTQKDGREEGNRIEPIRIKRSLKKKEIDFDMNTFNWMNYLRFIIIGGILIALFVLLAGQALQIGKSME